MIELKKILVPTDFSAVALSALLTAGKLAKQAQAEVVALHAIETYDYNTTLENLGITYKEVLSQTVKKKMEELIEKNEELQDIKISHQMESGKTHKVINQIAQEENCDLIVMGTHGASGIGHIEKFVLGSNAYRVVNSSKLPVLTIRRDQPISAISTILLPLDLSKNTTQKVNTAISIAKLFNASIHAITVTEFFDDFNPKIDSMDTKLGKVEEEITNAGIDCTIASIQHKDVAAGVMDYANENAADLIVIMTRQESIINEFFLGSHSRKVIGQSQIPVLSLRPGK